MRKYNPRRLALASVLCCAALGTNTGHAQSPETADGRRPAASVAEERDSAPLVVRDLIATLSSEGDLLVAADLDVISDLLARSSPAPAIVDGIEATVRAMIAGRLADQNHDEIAFSRIEQAALSADWTHQSIFMTVSPSIADIELVDGAPSRLVVGEARAALRSPYLHIGSSDRFDETLNGNVPRFSPETWWPDAWQRVPADAPAIFVLSGTEWISDLRSDVRGLVSAVEPRRLIAWLERDGSVHALIDAGSPSTITNSMGGAQASIAAMLDAERGALAGGPAALAEVARLAIDASLSRISVTTEGSIVSIDIAAPQCGGLTQQLGAASMLTAMAAVAYESGYATQGVFETPEASLATDCLATVTEPTIDARALRIVGGGPGWRGLYATVDLDAVLLRHISTFGGWLPFALDRSAVEAAIAPLGLDELDFDVTAYVEETAGGSGAWFAAMPTAMARLLPSVARRELLEIDDVSAMGDVEVLERTAPPNLPGGWERAFSLASVDSPFVIVISGSNVQRLWQPVSNHLPRSEFGDLMAGAQAVSLSLDVSGRPTAWFVGDFAIDAAAATTSLRTLVVRGAETLAAVSGSTSPSDLAIVRESAEQFAAMLTMTAVGDDTLALTVDLDGDAALGSIVGALVGFSPLLPRLERQMAIDEAYTSLYAIHGTLNNLVYNAQYPAPATVSGGVPRVIVFPPSVAATPGIPALEAACDDSNGWISYDPDRWDDPTWQALEFAPPAQHRFVYSFDSSKINSQPAFTAQAIGDLDCDGVYSTYRIFGMVDAGGWLNGGWIESDLPGE